VGYRLDAASARACQYAHVQYDSPMSLHVLCAYMYAGAMYSFPRIHLPAKAIAAANAKGVEPDFLYCEELLDATGICTVPGSGFGQEEGTYHFRTTFLPQEKTMEKMIVTFAKFQGNFMSKYA
jgi:aspartate/methionine/tyrosine aminotransferase